MIKIAICDDDVQYINSIKQIIEDTFNRLNPYDEKCECITYESGNKLIEKFVLDEVDIFFLDIECGNMSGFDIARGINNKRSNSGIVYITKHANYVSDAFVCRPLGFIRKEFIEKDIIAPMYNVFDYLKDRYLMIQLQKDRNKISVPIDNIMAMRVFKHKLQVFFSEKLNYLIEEYSGQLAAYEETLLNNSFIKISRESLVNLKYVKNICGDEVVLMNDNRLVISRRRLDETNRMWRSYI